MCQCNRLINSLILIILPVNAYYAQHQFYVNAGNCGDTFTDVSFPNAPGVFTVTSSLNGKICTLISTGYIPNTVSPTAIRVLQASLISYGIAQAPVMSAKNVSMTGNATIQNLSVSSTSLDYEGSTINAGGTVNLTGNVRTIVSGLNPSSTSHSINDDIKQNNSDITQSNLFMKFFTKTLDEIKSTATQVLSESNLANVGGGTYYVNNSLNLIGNDHIGTIANPALLIVNGNLSLVGNVTLNGLIYSTGTLSIIGNASITGAIAAENGISFVGNASLIFSDTVMNNAHQSNENTVLHYNANPKLQN